MNVFVYCLLIYVIFLCVNAGIFILNMMDHKWSAYHDLYTPVERTALKLFIATLFKLFLYFHCQSFIYLKIVSLCE